MPKIATWCNGHLLNHTSLAQARMVAGYLRGHGWEAVEVYDIGMLVLFSPKYGEIKKGEVTYNAN